MTISEHLKKAVDSNASDLFLIAGARPSIRVDGRLVKYTERLLPGDTAGLVGELYRLAGRDMSRFQSDGDDDFSFSIPGLARFRVNTYRQRGSAGLVARLIPFGIPDHETAHIPPEIMALEHLSNGMVLVTGTAGSGKSTTQACLLDRINRDRDAHIVTLEDPIEYLHKNQEGIVSQREIGLDTKSYLTGLTACLRESPDVILLGEMRDPETIQTALTAAETGHLVIATLHTKGAANAVDRIIDAFPPAQQAQVRLQASMVLDTVISQSLVRGVDGGRVPLFEILKFMPAVRTLVREGKTHQLEQVMEGASQDGMWPQSMYAKRLLDAGLVDADTVSEFLDDAAQRVRQPAPTWGPGSRLRRHETHA